MRPLPAPIPTEAEPVSEPAATAERAAPAVPPPAAAASPVRSKAQPQQPASRTRRIGSAVGYGMIGFLLGAVFWHFVGFWDFVGQVMFRGHAHDHQITQAPAPIKLKERVGGASGPLAVVLEPGSCSTLQLDRDSGQTSEVPCESATLPLRSLRLARREDLWVTASQRIQQTTSRGWAMVTVETPTDRPAAGQTAAAD